MLSRRVPFRKLVINITCFTRHRVNPKKYYRYLIPYEQNVILVLVLLKKSLVIGSLILFVIKTRIPKLFRGKYVDFVLITRPSIFLLPILGTK